MFYRDFRIGSTEMALRVPTPTSEVTKPFTFDGGVRGYCQEKGGAVGWTTTYLNGSVVVASATTTASFSSLDFEVHLTRDPGYYTSNVIPPMVLVVTIAWMSFFISRTAVPARVALTIISFLTLAGQLSSLTSTLPASGSSVWLLDLFQVSFLFVFVSIVEYTLANVLMRVEARVGKKVSEATKKVREARELAARSITVGFIPAAEPAEQTDERSYEGVQTKVTYDELGNIKAVLPAPMLKEDQATVYVICMHAWLRTCGLMYGNFGPQTCTHTLDAHRHALAQSIASTLRVGGRYSARPGRRHGAG